MSVKKSRKKRNAEEEPKTSLKQKMSDVLELPKEIVLNVPKLTMIGNNNLMIENYKGIVEYDNSRIRLNTASGIVRITGEWLSIKEITSEDVMVEGTITSLEFLK